MRVLYICHRVPYPPNKGDKIRAFHQLQAIAARHEVDLFTLADKTIDLAGSSILDQYCRRKMIAEVTPALARLRLFPQLLSRKPLSLGYFYSSELELQIRKALLQRSYDRIFVYCSSMAQYVDWVDHIPTLIDIVDVDSDKWLQYATFKEFPFSMVYRREGRTLEEYERRLYRKFPVLVTTEREAQVVRKAWNEATVHVVPNGVDTTYFDPTGARTAAGQPTIIFVGDMAYFPNEEAVTFFALKVLPLVRISVPNVLFLIVGRDPSRSVRHLQKIRGVTVTGSVPDVRPYLAKAQVSVAPFSIATGIQNKILEAMAYALPVVATPRAVQGLSKSVAEIVETGRTPEELAALVVDLLRNPRLSQDKGAEGRQRVAAEYNWDRSMDRLLELLEVRADATAPREEAFIPAV